MQSQKQHNEQKSNERKCKMIWDFEKQFWIANNTFSEIECQNDIDAFECSKTFWNNKFVFLFVDR